MRRIVQHWIGKIGLLAIAFALAAPGAVQAQPIDPPGSGAGCPAGRGPGRAWRDGGPGTRRFDPSAATTLQGEVTEVQRIAKKWHAGVHLAVATGSGTTLVALGPDFYVDGQSVTVGKGDHVEVLGWQLSSGDSPVFVAQQVKRGSDVLNLRTAAGAPLWSGRRAR